MKRTLSILLICLIGGYLIYAVIKFKDNPNDLICLGLDIEISSNTEKNFLEEKEIERIIVEKTIHPKDKLLKEINTDKVEEAIKENQLIKDVEVFITNTRIMKVRIFERTPIIRIITNTDENYYIDDEGVKMPVSKRYAAYIPLATGYITEEFATNQLYTLGQYLQKNKFWNAQIEQIHIKANKDIVLIPRVGDQKIALGKIEGFETKLEKLMTFYQKGLNEIGWNKYSIINLEYDKQVVAKKRY